jgi:DNA-binding response OmpR family regulator
MTGRADSVLVCDDDALLLDLLEYKLKTRGYNVTRALDGEQAMAKLDEARPDIVVLDAMMPTLDGFEVLRRIKENPRLSSLPVLMLTARKQERDIVAALELGASDYLVKPFNPEELLARLARILAVQAK